MPGRPAAHPASRHHTNETTGSRLPELPRRLPGAHLLPLRLDQWHANGDHPEDDAAGGREGKVVRYFRHPYYSGTDSCPKCHAFIQEHGWIDDGSEDGHTVCPGDFILTTTDGRHLPIPADALVALGKELAP